MGAAFMLLETRMVTALSLLFGSTWVVNSSVFSGILLTVFFSNVFVARREPKRVAFWYLPLSVALLTTWAITPGRLNSLPILERGIVGGVLYWRSCFASVRISVCRGRPLERPRLSRREPAEENGSEFRVVPSSLGKT